MTASRAGWGVVSFLAVLTGAVSLAYVLGDPRHFHPIFRDKYTAHLMLVRAHGVASVLALGIGPAALHAEWRRRHLAWHRIMGRVYAAAVVVGSLTGFRMGLMAYGGVSSDVAFCLFAVAWLTTVLLAWRCAMRHDVAAHRRWMIRNYCLTFGAVLLRLELHTLQLMGCAFAAVYSGVSWGGFLPCVAFGEWLLRAKRIPEKRRRALAAAGGT